jgi:acyl-CoA reductase-like NAD-dependent aldehyde dehydrogenase
MVSFTGSIRAGQRVAVLAAETIKKVTLELGGKSAFIVLDDAPLEKAIPAGVNNAMLNSGQTCSAWTRMVVPRARMADVLDLASAALARLRMGDPSDPKARTRPSRLSAATRAGPKATSRKGPAGRRRLVAGGSVPEGFARGYYVEPTIFADVDSKMTIAQEEIFGPVLAVLPYDTEEEAIAIANDTIYGLAGGVWSGDNDRAIRVARRLRTGQVDVNGGRFNPFAAVWRLQAVGHRARIRKIRASKNTSRSRRSNVDSGDRRARRPHSRPLRPRSSCGGRSAGCG